MEVESSKNNKPIIIAALVTLFLLGGGILAFNSKNSNNPIASIFQKKLTLPAGASVTATLNTTVSSETSNIGDIVVATVTENVSIGDKVLFPQGSKVYGKVAYLEKASNIAPVKSGAASISFNEIEINGSKIQIVGSTPVQRAEVTSKTVSTVVARTKGEKFGSGAKSALVGAAAGAALGTAIGAIAGGRPGRGAWSGAAIGGGLGTAKGVYGAVKDPGKVITTTQQVGNEMILKSGDPITFTLEKSVQVTPQVLG